jgi:orotidine-5'-phosphate decarboxylase
MRQTRIILALDCDSAQEAERLVDLTTDAVDVYKVGSILFTADGPEALGMLKRAGKDVFLDLKFHDIPNTVKGAVKAACRWGVGMLTVHCSGGVGMMQAAMAGAVEGADLHGGERPRIIGVTRLTSMVGNGGTVGRVLELAGDAVEAGIDGVVCSPREVGKVKMAFGDSLVAVVPGIRLPDQTRDDQGRTGTPGQAAHDGADYIVVGRSVTASESPAAALDVIRKEVVNARRDA